MLRNLSDKQGTANRHAWCWRRGVLPLLLALLALGFMGGGTALAHASTQLRPATVSYQTADAGPAIVFFNGTAYVGWTGTNGAHNLNLMTYNGTTQVFSPAQVLTDTTLVGSGPSLAVFNSNLYVAWQGTDRHLNVARYNSADPTHLAGKVILSETSNNAPSIAAFNGRLYLTWRGTEGSLNIISSADATTFNNKVTYGIKVRTSPTVSGESVALFVVWEDTSANSYIVVGRYDPTNPASLSAVVTTTSTSLLPVGLENGPESSNGLTIAWRTASDAHIRFGIWTGSATITGINVTFETTNYGSTVDGGALCWTGTDGSRHVNVTPQ